MMILLRALVGIGLVVLLAAGASYLLPREVTVTRTVTINAPPEAIFPHLNSLRKFAEWSPWHGIDPAMTQRFAGPEQGVGNRMQWSSDNPKVGSGSQEISASVQNKRVETEIDFDGQGTATSWLDLEPAGTGTRVTWGLLADMGNSPVGRYMGLMMDRWIGADYDKGLARLKEMVEAG